MCEKRKKNKKKKKTKKLSQFLKSHISGMPEAISLKFGMWSTEVGGNVYSKICLVSSRQHRATEVRKLRFLSSCQYTHGVARRLLGLHDTLPCVLILHKEQNSSYEHMDHKKKKESTLFHSCSKEKDKKPITSKLFLYAITIRSVIYVYQNNKL